MGIIDIALIAVAVVALAIGIYKGFAGMVLGFLGTIIIAVVLGVAVHFILPTVMYQDKNQGVVAESETLGYTTLYYQVYSVIAPRFVDNGNDLFDTVYVEYGDGLGVETLDEEGNVKVVALNEYFIEGLAGSAYGKYLSGVSGVINILTNYGAVGLTIGHSIAALFASLAFGAIIWVIAFIVAFVIKLVIRHFVFKALDSNPVVSKIDRAIGAVVAVVLIVAVAWAAFSFVDVNKLNWNIADDVNAWIGKNKSLAIMSQNNLFTVLGISNQETPTDTGAEVAEVSRMISGFAVK